jgi:hypothetical protein
MSKKMSKKETIPALLVVIREGVADGLALRDLVLIPETDMPDDGPFIQDFQTEFAEQEVVPWDLDKVGIILHAYMQDDAWLLPCSLDLRHPSQGVRAIGSAYVVEVEVASARISSILRTLFNSYSSGPNVVTAFQQLCELRTELWREAPQDSDDRMRMHRPFSEQAALHAIWLGIPHIVPYAS